MLSYHVAVVHHQRTQGDNVIWIFLWNQFVHKLGHCGNQNLVENIDVQDLDALVCLFLLIKKLFHQPPFDLLQFLHFAWEVVRGIWDDRDQGACVAELCLNISYQPFEQVV